MPTNKPKNTINTLNTFSTPSYSFPPTKYQEINNTSVHKNSNAKKNEIDDSKKIGNGIFINKIRPDEQLFLVQSLDLRELILQPSDPAASNFLLQAVSKFFLCPTTKKKKKKT